MARTATLDALLSAQPVECSGQSGNRSWCVEYGGAAQILKQIVSPPVISRHDLLARLEASSQIPPGYIPPVIRTRKDAERSELWVMTPFRGGRSYSFSHADIDALLDLWERMRKWSREHRDWLYEHARSHALRWLSTSEEIAASIEEVLAALERSNYAALAARIRTGVSLVLPNALIAIGRCTERGLIHGDLHGGNLIYSENHLVAAVDWDEVAYGPPEYDLAKGLWLLCRRARGQFEMHPTTVRYYVARTNELGLLTSPAQLLDLGALAFVPTSAHINHLLAQDRAHGRSDGLMPWYVAWLHAFWDEFPRRREAAAAFLNTEQMPL